MIFIFLSILTGVIIVVSRILNTKLSEKIGLLESSYFNYLTGTVTSIILFLFVGESFNLSSLKNCTFLRLFRRYFRSKHCNSK